MMMSRLPLATRDCWRQLVLCSGSNRPSSQRPKNGVAGGMHRDFRNNRHASNHCTVPSVDQSLGRAAQGAACTDKAKRQAPLATVEQSARCRNEIDLQQC